MTRFVTCSHLINVESFIRQINDYNETIESLLCEKWSVKVPKVRTLKTYLNKMNEYIVPNFENKIEANIAVNIFHKIKAKASSIYREWSRFKFSLDLEEDRHRLDDMLNNMDKIVDKTIQAGNYCIKLRNELK